MVKSPLNYIGGKYKLLNQLFQYFPQKIGTFVDVFAGGLDVSLNVREERRVDHIICNDINHYVIGIYEYFQHHTADDVIAGVNRLIEEYNLTRQNLEGYNQLRTHYNIYRDSLELFTLVCYGYNHQFRFNNRGEFNNPFGRNRSSFNPRIETGLREMIPLLEDLHFEHVDFRNLPFDNLVEGDFVYADPPYRITCGSYNDGKRGFLGWGLQDDVALMNILDELNNRHIHFAMSNVLCHKGMENAELSQWAEQYHIRDLNFDYNNCSYNTENAEQTTREVLITNF